MGSKMSPKLLEKIDMEKLFEVSRSSQQHFTYLLRVLFKSLVEVSVIGGMMYPYALSSCKPSEKQIKCFRFIFKWN